MKKLLIMLFALLLCGSHHTSAGLFGKKTHLLLIEHEDVGKTKPGGDPFLARGYEYDQGENLMGEYGDVDVFVEMNMLDDLMKIARWELTLKNGTPLQEQPYPNKNGRWFRVPAAIIHNSRVYPGMKWFDVRVHGTQPGKFGRTKLGRLMGVDQDYFSFTQRFYYGSNIAWSSTRLVPCQGEPLLRGTFLEVDPDYPVPVIWIAMFTHNDTLGRLHRRLHGCTTMKKESTDGAATASADSQAGLNANYGSETGAGALLVMAVLARMVFDPTGVSTSEAVSSLYEYVYSTSSLAQ